MIDYSKLSASIEFYRRHGFLNIEIPWVASNEIISLTLPNGHTAITSGVGTLVGSAEQSFLQLIKDGNLPPGQYVSCSPCFRDDPIDEIHQQYFMKVELIETQNVSVKRLLECIEICKCFFEQYVKTEIIKTGNNEFDIIAKKSKIELGSYGIRSSASIGEWIYATGCAEPRLSFSIKKESSHV
jgi:hypothetical protein